MTEILITLLRENGDLNLQRMAVLTLGMLKISDAKEPLIECLKNADQGLKDVAAWGLGEVGTMKAVDPLIKCLNDDASGVRASAAMSLGKIGEKFGELLVREELIECLKDKEISVLVETVWALGRLMIPKIFDLNLLKFKEKITILRLKSSLALGTPGRWRDIPFPLTPKELLTTNEEIRVIGASIRSKRNQMVSMTLNLLIYFIKYPEEKLRLNAAEALINLGDMNVVDQLITCLKEYRLRAITARVLGKLGNSQAVKPLIKLLKDKNPKVRANSIEALGDLSAIEAKKNIMKCLKDEDLSVQQAAAKVLQKLLNSVL